MNITVNGEASVIAAGASLSELLGELRLLGQRLAIELNGDIVPRSAWPETRLNAGDQVEIVKAIGGG